ncbi:MAG: TIGR02757 family protein [Desulfococcaceae bacterium]
MKEKLEELYRKYNRREYADYDPLRFLYDYENLYDREIVALIASALAYGRVAQILKSVSSVLEIMGPSPLLFLKENSPDMVGKSFKGFRHRFATEDHLADLLIGAKNILQEYGSLYECFVSVMGKKDKDLVPALTLFCRNLIGTGAPGHLVPLPERGSACKRMNLFLRWMVRKDSVDPGGWDDVPKSKLIVPLDVHMHRISRKLGLTDRKAADMRTARAITAGFAQWVPEDPVRYDFALTRPGIGGEELPDFFE